MNQINSEAMKNNRTCTSKPLDKFGMLYMYRALSDSTRHVVLNQGGILESGQKTEWRKRAAASKMNDRPEGRTQLTRGRSFADHRRRNGRGKTVAERRHHRSIAGRGEEGLGE
jgi:hypothetical protein